MKVEDNKLIYCSNVSSLYDTEIGMAYPAYLMSSQSSP